MKKIAKFLAQYDKTRKESVTTEPVRNRSHADDEDRTSSEKWPFIYKYLKMDIPGYEDLSAKKKQAIKQLFTTKYLYADIISATKGILRTYPLTISAENFKNAITAKLAGINFHLKP